MRTKRMRILLLAAGFLLAIGALWAQPKTLTALFTRTQRVELVDKDGRIRAELKTSGEDTLLVLYDGQGRLRTIISTDGVAFYGTDGKLKAKLDAQTLSEGDTKNQ